MHSDVADQSPNGRGERLTVICVEDNADLLRLIKMALDADPALHCTHAFENGRELMKLLDGGAQPPDVLVTDWSMPGVCGYDIVSTVQASWPEVRVIVYTAYSDRAVVDAACEAGAWGVVSKENAFDVLISAIHNVADGRKVIRC